MIINNTIKDFSSNILNGKVGCFKTDTIWGFSANSYNEQAIANLYKIKNRNLDKPFIFLIANNFNVSTIVKNISNNAKKLMQKFWPGPLTIIFEAQPNLPLLKPYTNKQTIALRMPNDTLCQQILKEVNMPLPSTSVNLEGEPALNSFEDISLKFNNKDFCILNYENSSQANVSSTIVSCINNNVQILREGAITKQQILNALN